MSNEILVLSKPYDESRMLSGGWELESEPVMVPTSLYNFRVDENGDVVEGDAVSGESPALAFWIPGRYSVFWSDEKKDEAIKLRDEKGSKLGVLMISILPLAIYPDGETIETDAEDWTQLWYDGSVDTVEEANRILSEIDLVEFVKLVEAGDSDEIEAKGWICTTI